MAETFSSLLMGFQVALTPWSLFYCFLGVFLGALIGIVPGIGTSSGLALLLPFVFGMNPQYAIFMLAGIFYAALYADSITAVFLNIPGTASAVFSAVEGHPLYRQGKGAYALRTGFMCSFIATTFSLILLTFMAPMLAQWALRFGSAERFSLMFFAFVFVACLSAKNTAKNFIGLAIGILIALIGLDSVTGFPRFTFGQIWLIDGVSFVTAILGSFALCEIMKQAGEKGVDDTIDGRTQKISQKDVLPKIGELWALRMSILRGQIVGFIVGVMPGAGATIAVFITYNAEKKASKTPEKFGTGAIEGIASTETANSAAAIGSMVPLMGLGIPGSATTAVLLTAFIMVGLQPGPQLFVDNPEIAWGMISSMYLGNVMMILMCIVGLSFFVWIIRKVVPFVVPLIVTVCVAGAFAENNWIRDVWMLLAFGLIAYLFTLLEIPVVNVLLGLILGSAMEHNFIRALVVSGGDFTTFITRPVSGTLIIISILLIFWPLIKKLLQKLMNLKPSRG